MSHFPPAKKPSGGRPLRTASVDSTTSEKSQRSTDTLPGESRKASKLTTLRLGDLDEATEDSDPFFGKGIVDSPIEEDPIRNKNNNPQYIDILAPRPSRPGVNPEPTSPSRARWDTVRRHIMHSPSPSVTPPQAPSLQSIPKPFASPLPAGGRPGTPKSSRFPKLGMRQVVDTAREFAVDDMRKFALELERACVQLRVPDIIHNRFLRDGSASASALSLSMPHSAVATPSLQSGNWSKQTGGSIVTPPQPSVLTLLRTLEQYEASLLHLPRVLPHENQVLSALLVPFMAPEPLEREQDYALRAFILLIKTWRTDLPEAELDRCLWCCSAAARPSRFRPEIIGAMSTLLFSRDATFRTETPVLLQTILQALCSLLPTVSSSPGEFESIKGLILEIWNGGSGLLSKESVEQEFGTSFSSSDAENDIREALAIESVLKCTAYGTLKTRTWIMHNLIKGYWPTSTSTETLSPLLTKAHSRKICTFVHAAHQLIEVDGSDRCSTILDTIESLVLPEVARFNKVKGNEAMRRVALLVVQILCFETKEGRMSRSVHLLTQWIRNPSPWRFELEGALEYLVENDELPKIARVFSSLGSLPGDVQKSIVTACFPKLCDRLTTEPITGPDSSITELLLLIAKRYPQVFFKPLFSCAASNKEVIIANYLRILITLSTYLPNLLTSNAEMMSVALMGNLSNTGSTDETGSPAWEQARLGHCVVVVELITRLRTLRKNSDVASEGLVAFVTSLESRLAILLEAKERTTLVPFSQRALYCILFYEMRLITRSLKQSPWINRVLQWVTQWHEEHEGDLSFRQETELMVSKLLALYSTVELGSQPNAKLRSTMVLATFSIVETPSTGGESSTFMSDRKQLLWTFSNRFEAASYPLLVLICGLLSTKDYITLCPLLWSYSLAHSDPKILASTCFLAMQCAEKCGNDFVRYIAKEMSGDSPMLRHSAIHKVEKLISWRFQIGSQAVILDKTFKRPFKMARPPISFVPTDIGSPQFIREQGGTAKDNKNALPLELRKRLLEIGWDDEEGPLDQILEWATTPMSLIPGTDLAKVDSDDTLFVGIQRPVNDIASKPAERETPTSRQSTADGAIKRRPVLVTSLLSIFPRIISLALDPDFVVANTARNLVLELMREDPTSLSRPVLSAMTGKGDEMSSAISTLRELTHISHRIPSATAHFVFTHLTGYLKFAARQMETIDALHGFAYTVPVLSKLVSQVNGMIMREVRKAKLEVFLVPNLSLWFPSTAPISPMFPQSIGDTREASIGAAKLRWMTMIRTAQNILFFFMLKNNAQDVHAIRKNLGGFSLPGDDHSGPTNLVDFIPGRTEDKNQGRDPVIDTLSLVLSRSYLLLVAQIFRSMSRHMNNREEFSLLVDGINRILLVHGDDLGIVAQAMIALMVASTRFRRLFMSTGGYTLFMPAVFKAYSQSHKGSAIRLAIEYGTNRFYAQHEEAFVFQTLDVLSLVVFHKECPDHPGVAEDVFNLLSTLRHTTPQNTPDPAGIHDTNKAHEYESLLVRKAEVEPQGFLERMRSSKGEAIEIPLTEEPVGKSFSDDDMARLFLTVIAHNPDIYRAQLFLTMFRHFAPHVCIVTKEARAVVTEGTEALGSILLSKIGRTKLPDSVQSRSEKDLNLEDFDRLIDSSADGANHPNSPSDLLAMRLEYLSLVEVLAQRGAHLRPAGFYRVWELVKAVFREARSAAVEIADFLGKWTEASLLRNTVASPRFVLTFLRELTPVLRSILPIADLSPVLRAIARFSQDPHRPDDPAFSSAVTSICSSALDAFSAMVENSDTVPQEMEASIVELIKGCIWVAGEDVVSQLERRHPSHEFLSGIVLPFALSLKTSAQAMAENDLAHSKNRYTYPRAWVRVLAYAVSACRGNAKGSPSSQGEKGTEDDREERLALTMAVGLQIIKVVAIRASEDVTSVLPDVWCRTGMFLRDALKGGNAAFASSTGDYSQPGSPLQSPSVSPRTSVAVDQIGILAFPPSRKTSHAVRPRILDYMMWSLFEVLCIQRTQLLLEMRPMMQEKVRILEDQLRMERSASRLPTRQSGSRPTSGLFSKRGRFSRYQATTTPDQSPRARTSSLTSLDPDISNLAIRGRDPGYLHSSPSATSPVVGLPNIVHLGPVRQSAMFRTLESEGGGAIKPSQSLVIKSGSLTHAVFTKIRLVQTYLGYSSLLPNPDSLSVDDDPVGVSGWTKARILQSIVDETRALLDEFSKRAYSGGGFEFDDVGDNTVVVDPENLFTSVV